MKRFALKLTLGAVMALAGVDAQAQSADDVQRVLNGAATCTGCNLFQIDLSYRDLPDRNFAYARLRQSNLALSTMNGARFSGADLSIVNMFGARFTRADFTNANLQRATLTGAYFGYANFFGANLSGANLSGAEFTGVQGLSQSQLSSACGDSSTILPAGLSVPHCR